MTDDWTPYGLETYRATRNRKRRYTGLAVVLGLALAWTTFADSGIDAQTEVSANGGGNQIELEFERREPDSGPDAVVSVSPGRISEAIPGEQAAASTTERPNEPQFAATPIYWPLVLLRWAPIAILGLVLWAVFRGRAGKGDEINYGIFKGAMPLEMITASHAHLVVTSKEARGSLFGRTRDDFVPPRERLVPRDLD